MPLLEWQRREIIFPVVECRLRYQSPARYDDLLTIELWPASVGRVRIDFAFRVFNQANHPILQAETRHALHGPRRKTQAAS